jgi:hypothetical protein
MKQGMHASGLIADADTLGSSKSPENPHKKQSVCLRRTNAMVLIHHKIRLMAEASDSRAIAHKQWVSQ